MIKRSKSIKFDFINNDFEWGASEAPVLAWPPAAARCAVELRRPNVGSHLQEYTPSQ
jgi:hypothetical protein